MKKNGTTGVGKKRGRVYKSGPPPSKRRRRRGGAVAKVIGMPAFTSRDPFAPTKICKMFYSDLFAINAGTLGILGSENVFQLNAPYDIDLTGIGHQPYGYDTMTTLYGRGIVTHVEITIEWTDPSADGMFVAALLQGNVGVTGLTGMQYNRVREIPMTCTRTINNTGSQKTIMKFKTGIHTLFGITKSQYFNDLSNYSFPINAPPNQPCYLRFSAGNLRGTSSSINACVTLVQRVKWYDRYTLAQS